MTAVAASPARLPESDDELLALAGIRDLPPAREGLFRDGSWLRRVSSERVLLFGGGRALLLEVAHPLVAAGVAEHSDFRSDPFGRLQRTLDAMSTLTFADRERALAAARRVESAHERVRGVLGESLGRFPVGTSYDGRAPDLVCWVWATLVDTAWIVYQHFVAPLDGAAREAYYADHCVLARLLGVPADRVPPDWAAFRRYFDGMLEGDALCVGSQAREIAESVLHPPSGLGGAGTVRLVTAGLLPERLREAFGLPWDEDRAARLAALEASVRGLRRPTP
jgi:uncharacterized protein (DUF2236 family)